MMNRASGWILAGCLLFTWGVAAQTVLSRQRLGNASEGMTYVDEGRWRGHAVVVDDFDVIAIPLRDVDEDDGENAKTTSRGAHKIFDVRNSGIAFFPNAIAFVPGQRRFYFSSSGGPAGGDTLYVTDENGRPLPPLMLKGRDLSDVQYREGLSWIPWTSPFFPGHLAAVTLKTPSFYVATVQFIALDGTVDGEIPIDLDKVTFPLSVAFRAPAGLLLGDTGNVLWPLDFSGKLGAPVAVTSSNPRTGFEGLASLPDGRILAASYGGGRLYVLDSSLRRLRGQDRDFRLGPGLSDLSDVDFMPDTGEFLMRGLVGPTNGTQIAGAVSGDAEELSIITALDQLPYYLSAAASYDAKRREVLMAAPFGFERGVYFFDRADGHYLRRISTRKFRYLPRSAVALPDGNIAVLVRTTNARREIVLELHLLSAGGTPDPSDPSAVFASELPGSPVRLASPPSPSPSLALHLYQPPTGPVQLILGNVFYNLDGSVARTLPLSFFDGGSARAVTAISSGPLAGLFATISLGSLIVFSLP
ncbi:MAG: hypothetical protein NVS2B9_04360 [Myxococcales bacterium]